MGCCLSPVACLLPPEFNTSFSAEIEISGRFLPACFAKNSRRFCKKGHIALRYGPFCIAIWPILEADMTLFAGRKKAVLGLKRAVSEAVSIAQ